MKTPFQEFLDSKLATGLTRGQFGAAIGKNVTKALRRFDLFYQEARGDAELIVRIAHALQCDLDELKGYYKAELKRRHEGMIAEERRVFKPHLWTLQQHRIPSPIHVVAFCGVNTFRRINLPKAYFDLPEDDLEHREEIAANIIRTRYTDGTILANPFGKVTGYLHRYSFERASDYSLDGQFLGPVETDAGQFSIQARVSVRGQSLVESSLREKN